MQHHISIVNNYQREKYLFLTLSMLPPFIKGTKKGETTCNFKFFLHISSHKLLFTSMTHVCLLPGWMPVPSYLFGTSPLEGGGATSTTSGEGEGISTNSRDDKIVTTSSSLQKQEIIS